MYKGPIRHMYMHAHTHLPCSAIWTPSLLADVDWGLVSQLSTQSPPPLTPGSEGWQHLPPVLGTIGA